MKYWQSVQDFTIKHIQSCNQLYYWWPSSNASKICKQNNYLDLVLYICCCGDCKAKAVKWCCDVTETSFCKKSFITICNPAGLQVGWQHSRLVEWWAAVFWWSQASLFLLSCRESYSFYHNAVIERVACTATAAATTTTTNTRILLLLLHVIGI